MKISSRFSVAIHILTLLKMTNVKVPTSAYIAGSVNTNPVVIRRILGMLKEANLVEVKRGNGGAYLLRSSDNITLLDIYKAVVVDKDRDLFRKQASPNNLCPVGANILSIVEPALDAVQEAMETELKKVLLADIVQQLSKKIATTKKLS
ncbi:MAG: Rrf2 family transcriptional regulator [Clostridiales bacterium]